MADQYIPGLQMQNWASMPSLSEAIMGQQGKAKNPLLSAIGYGLNQLAGGDSTAGNYFQYGKSEAPQQTPGVAPPMVPQQQSVAPVPPPSMAPVQTPQTSTLPPVGDQPQSGQGMTIDYSKYLFSTR